MFPMHRLSSFTTIHPQTAPLMQRVVEVFSIFTSKSIYILFFSIQAYALILFLFIPLHVLICATLHRCYIFLIPLRSFSFFLFDVDFSLAFQATSVESARHEQQFGLWRSEKSSFLISFPLNC